MDLGDAAAIATILTIPVTVLVAVWQVRRAQRDAHKRADVRGAERIRAKSVAFPNDTLHGRDDDLDTLTEIVEKGEVPLVITGPPGGGKTRLALELCRRFDAAQRPWAFTPLSSATSQAGLVRYVAEALGVQLTHSQDDDPIGQLGRIIQSKGEILLILDKYEQLAPLAEATVMRWAREAPDADIVVTSQVRLPIPARHWKLDTLPVPKEEELRSVTAEAARTKYASIRLFEDRRAQLGSDYRVTDEDAAAVGGICSLLDGIPLGIEMVAALDAFAPSELLDRLRHGFELARDARAVDADPHASLTAAFSTSVSMLRPAERRVLADAALFEDGFFAKDAEALVESSRLRSRDHVVSVLQRLLDHNLLRAVSTPLGMNRLLMYRVVRDLAHQLPDQSGNAVENYVRYFHNRAIQWSRGIHSANARRVLDLAEMQLGNVIAAINHAIDKGQHDAVGDLVRGIEPVFYLRGPTVVFGDLLRDWIERTPNDRVEARLVLRGVLVGALARSVPHATLEPMEPTDDELDDGRVSALSRARVATRTALAAELSGNRARSARLADVALRLSGGSGLENRIVHAEALCRAASLRLARGDHVELRKDLKEIETLNAEIGSPLFANVRHETLGNMLANEGHFDEALVEIDAALRLAEELNVGRDIFHAKLSRAGALSKWKDGDIDEALRVLEESGELARLNGDRIGEADVLTVIADTLALRKGEFVRAADRMREVVVLYDSMNNPVGSATARGNLAGYLVDAGDHSSLKIATKAAADFERLGNTGHINDWLMQSILARAKLLVGTPDAEAFRRAVLANSEARELECSENVEVARAIHLLRTSKAADASP